MEAAMAIPVDSGRPGDIWRLYADDQPARVGWRRKVISFKPLAQPDGLAYGLARGDWGHTLQRFREDLGGLADGDVAHVYVPESDIYILQVADNRYRASGKGWVA